MVRFLARHATHALALGVFVGLLAPPLASFARPILTPAIWVLLVLSMLRVDWRDVAVHFRRPLTLTLVLVWMLAVTPLLMWVVVSVFEPRPGLAAAMVMAAGSSPLMSTPAIGILLGLDGALLLAVLVPATLLVSLTLPVVAIAILGLTFELGVGDLMARLAGLVGSALVTAVVVRRLIGGARVAAASELLDGWAVIWLLVFAVGIMDGITARLLADPGDVVSVMGLTFAVYLGLMVAGAVAFLPMSGRIGWRAMMSIGFTSGCRNLAVVLAVLPDDSDPDMMLYFAVGQFPIYIMPAVLKIVAGAVSVRMERDGRLE